MSSIPVGVDIRYLDILMILLHSEKVTACLHIPREATHLSSLTTLSRHMPRGCGNLCRQLFSYTTHLPLMRDIAFLSTTAVVVVISVVFLVVDRVIISSPAMASVMAFQSAALATPVALPQVSLTRKPSASTSRLSSLSLKLTVNQKVGRGPKVVCAVGDVSPEGTKYLIAGAVAIALVGTALPILFSRKDLCPECDGAGFVRKPGSTLSANAARKDLDQIVCKRCKGLGKLGQTDKA